MRERKMRPRESEKTLRSHERRLELTDKVALFDAPFP